jgi:hypothetical protein
VNTGRVYVSNNLIWAVLCTIFCCLPFGIVSIVYAAKVDGMALAGDTQGARMMADKARNWALAGALIGPALLIVYIFLMGGLAALGSL